MRLLCTKQLRGNNTMQDDYCKCTRCRNVHKHGERIDSKPDKHGMRTLLCPNCNGKNFYKVDSAGKLLGA